MQGYILDVKKAKNEDTIVAILTPDKIEVLYRFYGARHPIVTTGYKIDFEVEIDSIKFMPKLRNITHLGFPWILEVNRLRVWQNFITLLYEHLKDIEKPGDFYYGLLERYASIWHLQNPKRASVEAYLRLLSHEGRLHPLINCFVCLKELENKVSLIRAYLPAHPKCVISSVYDKDMINKLFQTKSTIELDDEHVQKLWRTMNEGF